MTNKNVIKFKDEQIIRYMGNKRNILNHVVKAILKVHDPNKYFLDLMSGTNSVAYAIKTHFNNAKIITNDVEAYSYVIAKALIENNEISQITIDEAKKDILQNFNKNMTLLNSTWNNRFILRNQYRTEKRPSRSYFLDKKIYCLFTFYFSNVYFSLNQCKEIDSLRYAIEQINDETKKYIYLTCLLYAVSYGSSSYGHFAQPRTVISEDVLKIRRRSICALFFDKLEKLNIELGDNNNTCFNMNYNDLFSNKNFLKISNNIGTIYLDPPYSEANYSRFYHILETLIKYDYPENRYNGLYRDKRFLSTFCKKATVKKSFEQIIEFSYSIQANLIISYSNTGLLTKRQIMKLCRNYYTNVWNEKDIHHLHSTQGNRKKNGVKEVIIICKY